MIQWLSPRGRPLKPMARVDTFSQRDEITGFQPFTLYSRVKVARDVHSRIHSHLYLYRIKSMNNWKVICFEENAIFLFLSILRAKPLARKIIIFIREQNFPP